MSYDPDRNPHDQGWPNVCRQMERGRMVTVRKRDAGFTLTELMVVVVIISLLAAVSTPLFSRDNNARKGRDWAKMVAQLLQRARFQSMGDRANIHVVFSRTQVDIFREDPPGTYRS